MYIYIYVYTCIYICIEISQEVDIPTGKETNHMQQTQDDPAKIWTNVNSFEPISVLKQKGYSKSQAKKQKNTKTKDVLEVLSHTFFRG